MIRQCVCGVAIVASVSMSTAIAAERVTLIMTDGQRKSGTIGSHGQDGESRYGSVLSLMKDGGGEERVQLGDVAIIDFGNGAPPESEFQGLPASASINVLILKNGTSQPGTFIDMYRGDTVKWRNQSNQTQDYPIREVSRIYVNPPAARSAWNANSGSGAVGTSGTTTLEPGAVRVDANQQWSNTGIVVRARDRVAFRATGQIKFGQGETQTANPAGNDSLKNPNYPVPGVAVGALIAKVGNSAPFAIGTNTQPIAMPANGMLMLGVNDNDIGDNSGFFSVVVTRAGR
jgi:hypothetical protein